MNLHYVEHPWKSVCHPNSIDLGLEQQQNEGASNKKSLTWVLKSCHTLWLPHRHPTCCCVELIRDQNRGQSSHGGAGAQDPIEVCGPWPDLRCSPAINQKGRAAPEETQALPGDKTFYLFIYLFFYSVWTLSALWCAAARNACCCCYCCDCFSHRISSPANKF